MGVGGADGGVRSVVFDGNGLWLRIPMHNTMRKIACPLDEFE